VLSILIEMVTRAIFFARDRFLPQFKKKNVKRRKAPTITKKEDNPFPPPQQPRKVDLELESGEYFLNQQAKQAKQREERTVANQEKKAAKRKQRAAEFVPPTQQLPAAAPAKTEDDQALEKLKEKFKKQKTDREKQSNAAKADLSSFLIKK